MKYEYTKALDGVEDTKQILKYYSGIGNGKESKHPRHSCNGKGRSYRTWNMQLNMEIVPTTFSNVVLSDIFNIFTQISLKFVTKVHLTFTEIGWTDGAEQGSLQLTWINYNPSMSK